MTARAPAQRGYTLLELVIAIGMTGFLVAAAVTLLVNQHRTFEAGTWDRGLQESGQTALIAMGDRLRTAGYGVDPAYTLDFGDMAKVPQQGLTAGQKLAAFQSYLCATAVRCRDLKAGPLGANTDEIVFTTRDAMFSRPVVSATTTELRVRGDLTRPLLAGQILQVMCLGGSRTRAYVTVGQTVAAATPPDPTKVVTIPLAAGVLTGALSTFPYQNDQLADACFGSGSAWLAKIERHRFYVTAFDANGAEVPIETVGARPYLMDDSGLTNADGTAAVQPVAQDVEDLQLTYFFGPAAAGGPVQPSGAAEGVNIADDLPAVTVAVPPPAIDDAPGAASRTTGNPANILAVRVGVVVRSPEPDVTLVSTEDRTLPLAGNRSAFLGIANYRRALFEETFYLTNLRSTSVVYCAVGTDPGMNVGGC